MQNTQSKTPAFNHSRPVSTHYSMSKLTVLAVLPGFIFLSLWAQPLNADAQGQDETKYLTNGHTISTNQISQFILSDVQDHIDTIAQAALWPLLEMADHVPIQKPITEISPETLYNNPQAHRGKLFSFHAIVHPTIAHVTVDHPRLDHQHILYAIAQLPFEQNRRMPAIFISQNPIPNITIYRQRLTGYFYMILRAPTQANPGSQGPTELDYLVFVVQSKAPDVAGSGDTKGFGRPLDQLWWNGGLLVLAAVWIWLRRRVAPLNKTKGR